MTFIVRRSFPLRGRRLSIGDRIKSEQLGAEKASQLIGLRWIEPLRAPKMSVAKKFVFRGTEFRRGEAFPLEGISVEKRNQLLEHKFIQPTTPATT